MEKVTEKKVAAAKTDEQKVAPVQANEKAAAKTAEKSAEFKAKKQEAAHRFAEKQKQKKEELAAFAKEIVDNKDIYGKLSDQAKKVVQDILNPARATGNTGVSFLNKVFGDNPKVGDKVTLIEYMSRTFKGKTELDKRVKEWAEKGIIVEVKEATNLLETTYTITKLA